MNVLWLSDGGSNREHLLDRNIACKAFDSVSELAFAARQECHGLAICVVELPLSEETPGEIMAALGRAKPGLPVVFINEEGSAAEAVDLIKLGAYYYFDRRPEANALEAVLTRLAEERPKTGTPEANTWRSRLVGSSAGMEQVARTIDLIAPRRSTVLILGETGTGKEVVARAIHEASPRASHRMVAVNCPAIPDELLETELFGHVKGAFTGATNTRIGRFEQAHESTLFIDEVGDLPLELQAKLLRALQEREFQRVGSSETLKVDVRLIAATNVNLLERVKEGKFREDLYYRLNVVPIHVPPLRERASDIPRLARHFMSKVCEQEQIPIKSVSAEALHALSAYHWPGNVRQLENAVEMAVVLCGERMVLGPADFSLPPERGRKILNLEDEQIIPLPDMGLDFEQVISRVELSLLEQALQRAKGNKKLAASMLGLKRTTLAAKLKSLEAASAA